MKNGLVLSKSVSLSYTYKWGHRIITLKISVPYDISSKLENIYFPLSPKESANLSTFLLIFS